MSDTPRNSPTPRKPRPAQKPSNTKPGGGRKAPPRRWN